MTIGISLALVAACVAFAGFKFGNTAADATPGSDSLRLAVLAALNIADELFRAREANRARDTHLAERTSELEQLLDSVLMAS